MNDENERSGASAGSVAGGNVTVTMDATLTKDERKAIEYVVRHGRSQPGSTDTLRGLLERLE